MLVDYKSVACLKKNGLTLLLVDLLKLPESENTILLQQTLRLESEIIGSEQVFAIVWLDIHDSFSIVLPCDVFVSIVNEFSSFPCRWISGLFFIDW